MSNIRTAIDATFEGNPSAFRDAIHATIQDKIADALEARKQEMAKVFFNGGVTEAKASDEPEDIDHSKAAARKARQAKLDALEDRRREKEEEEGKSEHKSHIRKVAGKAYGGSAQKADKDEDE